MGNAPLPRPPAPTERKVVIPITTALTTSRHRIGTELVLQPPTQLALENANETENETTNTEEEIVENRPTAATSPPDDFPPQFWRGSEVSEIESPQSSDQFVISPVEYHAKMEELQTRLSQWHGGKIRLGIGLFSLMVVFGFFVAWMFPEFASSSLIRDQPFFVCSLGVILLVGYVLAFRKANQSTEALIEDVGELFRPWRGRHGIRVHLQQVSDLTLPVSSADVTKEAKERSETRTTNCFCLVMVVVDSSAPEDPDAADSRNQDADDISLGTVHTIGSDE